MSIKRLLVTIILSIYACAAFGQAAKPNILFVVIDDLNDYVGVLDGHPQVETPNMDALAGAGVLFTNAYCNAPLCGPSRTSFMSGKDLGYTQVYNNKQITNYFRDNFTVAKGNEEVIALPEHLKDNGYYTFSINKVFHNSQYPDYDAVTTDPCAKSQSWSRVTSFEDFEWVKNEMSPTQDGVAGFFWGKIADDLEDDMEDYRAVDTAIDFITNVGTGAVSLCGDAFFLAVGIARPHLDLFIPETFYSEHYMDDLYAEPFNKPYNDPYNAYPPNGIVMPPQPTPVWNDYNTLGDLGKLVAESQKDLHLEFENWREDLPAVPLISDTLTDLERNFIIEESKRANAVMAYIAAVEYVDKQVGRLIDALEAQPDLYNNTIIVLISDNGFSLGEKRHWLKRTLWDTDIRVPVVVVRPGKPGNKICNRNISLLDLYPTICDLATIPYPTFADGSEYLDGNSFLPLLNNVNKVWEAPALISWEAEPNKECSCVPQYAVRNQRFHYIKYQSDNGTLLSNVCNAATSIHEAELYDVGLLRETDPNEWNNLIDDPEYEPVIEYLQQFLPDSALYLQKPFNVNITNKAIACFLSAAAKLKLQTKFYNSDGTLLSGLALAPYQFKWTNSLTGAVQFGPSITFNMATVPPATFSSVDHIMFYLEVTKIADGSLVAFNTKSYAVNAINTPSASFDLLLDDAINAASIIDYNLTGVYKNTYWQFGDGFTTEDYLPATHYYAANGIYNVTNYVQYGNGCQIAINEVANLSLRDGIIPQEFEIYPNPASTLIYIELPLQVAAAQIEIFDVTGKKVLMITTDEINCTHALDINTLPQGPYFIKVTADNFVKTRQFEKL